MLIHAVDDRAGYMRLGPVIAEVERRGEFSQLVVDLCAPASRVGGDELDEIGFPRPARAVAPGRGSHAARIARMLEGFERVLEEERPALVLLAGDLDATLACALAAAKRRVPVARLQAGLRSGDWGADDEMNRVLIDRVGDALFTASPEAADNLRREGITDGRTHYVGNTLVDWLRRAEPAARRRSVRRTLDLAEHEYVLVSLHRPATVEDRDHAGRLFDALVGLADAAPVVLAVPARTAAVLEAAGRAGRALPPDLHRIRHIGLLDYLSLAGDAGAILTDAGAVQETASALGVPCYTLRTTIEHPVTLTHGTNTLLGEDPPDLAPVAAARRPPTPCAIPLWDGHAGERVADVLAANFALRRGVGVGR